MSKILKLFLFISLIGCTAEQNKMNDYTMLETSEFIDMFSELPSTTIFYDSIDEYTVGGIGDVKLHHNQVYLADESNPAVLILSKEGNLLQKVGRDGRGPGEYEKPISLSISDNELTLLDRNLSRITNYAFDEESKKYKLKTSGSFNLTMSDMCKSNSNVWVYARNDKYIVHRLGNDLNSISFSLAGEFENGDITIREISRNGVLSCGNKYIYSGFTLDNKISVHDKHNGSLYHQIEIEEIVPVEITQTDQNGRQAITRTYYQGKAYDDRGDYHDNLKKINLINDYLLIQYERFFSDAKSDTNHIVSIIVDLNENTYSISEELPLVYHYKNGNFLVGGDNPVPHIKIVTTPKQNQK